MTLELIQDASVTLVAVVAAAVILRRVMAFVYPSKSASGCSSCASASSSCAPGGQQAGAAVQAVPLRVRRRGPQTRAAASQPGGAIDGREPSV